MSGTPPPRDPRGNEPGPPAAKRAQMRDAVQDVMRKVAADREAKVQAKVAEHAKVGRRHVRGMVLVAVGAILLIAAGAWAMPRWRHPFPEREGPAANRDARIAILFTSRLVDNFVTQHRRLPRSLQEVGLVLPGVTYTPAVDTYVLSALVGGQRVTFTSTQSREAFAKGQ